jgi:hypothetical protein
LDPDPDPYPDPYWPPSGSSGSGSVKNEYGSETLKKTREFRQYHCFFFPGGIGTEGVEEELAKYLGEEVPDLVRLALAFPGPVFSHRFSRVISLWGLGNCENAKIPKFCAFNAHFMAYKDTAVRSAFFPCGFELHDSRS